MKKDKPPLRTYLVKEIEAAGYLSLDKITAIAITFGHKQDTARRILNKDMSKNIEPVYNDKHQIKGYKVREENVIMSADDDSQSKEISLGNSQQVYPSEGLQLSRLL